MRLLRMGSRNQCLLYSLAMLLNEKPDVLINEIGHDGTDIWWDHAPPFCYRGHHIQEVIDVCLARGKALVPIEGNPQSGCFKEPGKSKALWDPDVASKRMERLLKGQEALLIGQTHACAWDGNIVYDPNGRTCSLEEFYPLEVWLMLSSHQKSRVSPGSQRF